MTALDLQDSDAFVASLFALSFLKIGEIRFLLCCMAVKIYYNFLFEFGGYR